MFLKIYTICNYFLRIFLFCFVVIIQGGECVSVCVSPLVLVLTITRTDADLLQD